MTGPRRLAESEDRATRLVMEAALSESAPSGSRQRALVALGVATAAAGAAAGANAAALAVKGASGGAGAASAAKGGAAFVFAKWMGGGAAIGLLVSAGATALTPAPSGPGVSSQRVNPSITQANAPASPVLTAPATASPVDPPAAEVPPEGLPPPTQPGLPGKGTSPDEAPTQGAEPGATPPTASYVSPGDGLTAEVQLLDQARAALSSGASRRALNLLDQHQRRFPDGRLANEVFVMRLDALSRSGQRGRARQMAQAYLAQRPNAPHAARIRRLVGLAPAQK